jgi:hypothetical protein
LDPNQITVEERLANVNNYLKPEEETTMIGREEFLSIPHRLLKSSIEILED